MFSKYDTSQEKSAVSVSPHVQMCCPIKQPKSQYTNGFLELASR